MQKALEKMHRGLSLYGSHEGAGAGVNQTGHTARPRPVVEPSTRKNDQLGREELIKQYFFCSGIDCLAHDRGVEQQLAEGSYKTRR